MAEAPRFFHTEISVFQSCRGHHLSILRRLPCFCHEGIPSGCPEEVTSFLAYRIMSFPDCIYRIVLIEFPAGKLKDYSPDDQSFHLNDQGLHQDEQGIRSGRICMNGYREE